MTHRLIIVGCVARKASQAAPAKDLYQGPLWNARRAYAERSGCPWLIASAKHGILAPDTVIEPYDVHLRTADCGAWGLWNGIAVIQHCIRELHIPWTPNGPVSPLHIELHLGQPYADALGSGLNNYHRHGVTTSFPMAHLGIGEQLHRYKEHLQPTLPLWQLAA